MSSETETRSLQKSRIDFPALQTPRVNIITANRAVAQDNRIAINYRISRGAIGCPIV